jgi:hypothetical protein
MATGDSLATFESEITDAGHKLQRTYVGPVADRPDPDVGPGSLMHV